MSLYCEIIDKYNDDETIVLDLSLIENENLLKEINEFRADKISLALFCEMMNLKDRGFIKNISEEELKERILRNDENPVKDCCEILESEGLIKKGFSKEVKFTPYSINRRLDKLDGLILLYNIFSSSDDDYSEWEKYITVEYKAENIAINMMNRFANAKEIEDLIRYYAVSLDYIADVDVARSFRVETICGITIMDKEQRDRIFNTLKDLHCTRLQECIKNPKREFVEKCIDESNNLVLELRNPEDLSLRYKIYEKHGKFR